MEPLTAVAAAGLVVKYVLPAIKALGERVLDGSGAAAGDAAAAYGKRLLGALLHREDRRGGADEATGRVGVLQDGVRRRVRAMATGRDEAKTAAQLEAAIEDLLDAEPEVFDAVVTLLRDSPPDAHRAASRSVTVGGDNSGSIVTGDGNAITYR